MMINGVAPPVAFAAQRIHCPDAHPAGQADQQNEHRYPWVRPPPGEGRIFVYYVTSNKILAPYLRIMHDR
jgi:hypothetical protein